MSPHLPDDASRPQTTDEIEALAAQFLAQLQSGEKPDREAVVRAHPQLADRLARRLALVEMIYRVGLAPEADRTIAAQTLESLTGAFNMGAGEEMRLPRSSAAVGTQGPQRLGRYEVFEEIARGGMASVLRGRDPKAHDIASECDDLHSGLNAGEEDFLVHSAGYN